MSPKESLVTAFISFDPLFPAIIKRRFRGIGTLFCSEIKDTNKPLIFKGL
jgi:hypothetical protein